ncbi:IMP cyclohydrolase [bacterium]|nr:MAG: IMP cyclohydrolase [bacterium]
MQNEQGLVKIQRALLSVTDKNGLAEFANALANLWEVELISTGGTASLLRQNAIRVTDVEEYTGFPEILDGRVKTLHPKIYGGILGVPINPAHHDQMSTHGIEAIEMVVVNLYQFEKAKSKPGATHEEIIEAIDIGGPSMIRAAAKNYEFCAVVIDPDDYPMVLQEMEGHNGGLTLYTRLILAAKAFTMIAKYDEIIAGYFAPLVFL